ncbi:MAG: hypothetical protein IPM57_08320 [Oligoflexia bacterium]|nr:hypothetical protein [Oligoflexia bacterium]
MLFILLILSAAFSYEPPKLYSGSSGTTLYLTDKTPEQCLKDDQGQCIKIPPGEEIENIFLLNESGEKYESNKNQKPYFINKEKRLGYLYNNQVVAIKIEDLTKRMPIKTGFRTPEVPKNDCCSNTKLKSDKTLLNLKKDLESSDKIKTKLKQFHNNFCDSRRPKNPEKMDEEIKNLYLEWDEFIKAQPTSEEKKLAEQAKEIDLVARTVLYETHPLGSLDNQADSDKCSQDEDCPISACERKVITLSIYNRGNHPGCKTGKHYYGCKFLKDYTGVATKPSQYSIWNPTLTSIYMATCFYKNGLIESDLVEQDYKLRVKQYNKVVDTITNTLYEKDPYLNINYSESGEGPKQGIKKYYNYYHPQGMFGCFQDSFDKQHTTKIAYLEKDNNYGLLVLETIIPDTPDKEKTTFKMHKWNKPKNYNSENITYSLVDYNNEEKWTISKDQYEKLKLRYNCTNMGLSILSKDQSACSHVPKKHSFTSPLWAIDPPAKRAQFTCTIGTKKVTIGGECDVKFQPISGVP